MGQASRPLAVVTGASSGIGLELARIASKEGYDVVIVARDHGIDDVASTLNAASGGVYPVQADLSTTSGVDVLCEAIRELHRPVELLFANAGRGLGRAFLDQEFSEIADVINTNILGTVYLLQQIGRDMRARGAGKILVTGSIAGFVPGTFQAVYNGSKAFVDSFTMALRHELEGSGVSVTCLMPGATETAFFQKADMMDTKVGSGEKDDAADVARTGFDALMRGESSVIYGLKNKAQVAATRVLSRDAAAEMHRKQAAPGTAQKS
jgi:short-subunit dehydrogenase